MPSETTPLIQTVQVAPVRRRYPHQTTRRLCTVASVCLLVAGFLAFSLHTFVLEPSHDHLSNILQLSASKKNNYSIPFDELKDIFLETPSAEKAKEWSYYYTSGPHLAGKNLSQAEWTRDKWESWGISSSIATYDIYTNYPVDHSLALLKKNGDSSTWDIAYKASLVEDVLEEDPTTGLDDRIPTFHGYSANGNVTGQFVFANYGTYQDYADLVEAGIDLTGKIVIARYGSIFRGLKVKRAQDLGAIGVLLYDDPGDDGEWTEENGYKPYPEGPARNPSSVQRGSVQYLSFGPGDPTTPGYPSKPGAPRSPPEAFTPSIPSIPISYSDAIPILKALNGHGPGPKDLNKWWDRNHGLKHKGVEYYIGPSPEGVVLNLFNEQEYVITPQWDVIGIVNGTIPNEVIVLGNHRDAWIAGGAGDPNSGSAVINEVARSIGVALEKGWKPLRTIILASWDGEEYGLLGSTEWVEEYLPWIQDAHLAYINIDTGVTGTNFRANAAPLLNEYIRDVTFMVPSPNQTVPGQTVGDTWDGWVGNMGSGSDFTAFQDFAGVPCLDVGFKSDMQSIYHYHSNFDSFHWMEKYGDPGFLRHKSLAQLLGLLAIKLSDTIVVPFSASEYAQSLERYLEPIEEKLNPKAKSDDELTDEEITSLRAQVTPGETTGSSDLLEVSIKSLRDTITEFQFAALALDAKAEWAQETLENPPKWWEFLKFYNLWRTILNVNKTYKGLERHFLYEGGLDNRGWFKHVVFAPGLWTGYSGGKILIKSMLKSSSGLLTYNLSSVSRSH